jgi:DNA-binding MarR family transcriptional regulator
MAHMPRAKANRSTKTGSADVRWLDDGQQAAWRALAAVMVKLPWALECQLQRDADLSFIEYHVLARLSETPDHALRMSELAELTNASLSRLSHLVKRLESRSLVRRAPDAADGRFTNAMLTPAGYAKLVASAPTHVATVRSLVVDALSAAELQQLRGASERLLASLETVAKADVSS